MSLLLDEVPGGWVYTMMKRRILPVSLALCFAAAACSDQSTGNLSAEGDSSGHGIRTPAVDNVGPRYSAAPREKYDVIAEALLGSPDSSLLALSKEEARWLDRHGYPTQAELASIHSFDIDALEDAMRNRGDKKSAALLGHRLVADGDVDGALAAFSKGAKLGSLHARQQLAIYSAHRITGLPVEDLAAADQGNLGVLIASLEVARLLGDHRAQALIDKYGENFYWDTYGKQVLTQVGVLMDQYGEYTSARGERSFGPDPRPNSERWARLSGNPRALVTVYTRGP